MLENSFLQVSFLEGCIAKITAKENGATVTGQPGVPVFSLVIRDRVTQENATTYGEPGVQSQSRRPGSGSYDPLQGVAAEFLACEEKENFVRSRFRCGEWEFTLSYTLQQRTVKVGFSLNYQGKAPIYLSEAGFSLPVLRFAGSPCAEQKLVLVDFRNHSCELETPLDAPSCTLEAFDHLPQLPHAMGAMDHDFHHEIDFLISRGADRLFGWGREEGGTACSYTYAKTAEGLRFSPFFWNFCRLEQGNELACGNFTLTLFSAPDAALEEACYAVKREFNFLPEETAEVTSGCIYQKHGFIADGGGLAAELAELPYLQAMGVTIIYLQPLSPPEAYLNDLTIPVAGCFGGPEALKRYTDEAHRFGMKVIADMVLHSFYRDSELGKAHPEFIRRDETGGLVAYSIGTVTAEITRQEFYSFYEKVCRFLVVDCGLDGFRFDVAGFQLPGWSDLADGVTPGATVVAQTAFLQKLYRSLSAIKPILFLEEGMGVCGIRYVSHGILPFLRFLKEPDPALLPEVLRRLALLQRYHFLKDRPGVQTMLHVKIHDTVLAHFGRSVTGGDLALLCWVLLEEGVPFLTDALEHGLREEITQLLALRRECPELGRGKTDFSRLRVSDPAVMAFVRVYGGEKSLVAINFGGETKTVTIELEGVPVAGSELCHSPGSRFAGNGKFVLAENGAAVVKMAGTVRPAIAHPATEKTICIPWRELRFAAFRESEPFPETGYRSSQSPKLDEGSFSANEKLEIIQPEGEKEETAWLDPAFDDRDWPGAFYPSTRQPCVFSNQTIDAPYFEDRFRWEQNLFWSRSALLRNGSYARFRVHFNWDGAAKTLVLQCFSPSIYDFDLLMECGGKMKEFAARRNAVGCRINGHLLANEKERDFEEETVIPAEYLHVGDNVLSLMVKRGLGGHGGVVQLTSGGEKVPVQVKSAPFCREELAFTLPEAGKDWVLTPPPGKEGFTTFTIFLPPHCPCTLTGANGRVFTEAGRDDVPVRFNAYSGAELPLLRSDEFLSPGERFSFRCANWRVESLAPGVSGMFFAGSEGSRLVFASRNTPIQLRFQEAQPSTLE